MRKIKIIVILTMLSFFSVLFVVSKSHAQQTPQKVAPIILASVNVYNTKVVSQTQNNFKVDFDIFNAKGIQPDVTYSIGLVSSADKSQNIVDEQVFSESLTLNEGQTVYKEVNYTAPAFLTGKYQLWVFVRNSKSLPLGQGVAGQVELSGSGDWVEIAPASCYLTIQGDTSNKHYPIWQGVDINPNEILVGHCDITNHSSSKMSLLPQIKTKYRTVFGKDVPTTGGSPAQISLAPKEKKTMAITLPLAQEPQAYDAVLTLMDNNNSAVSNPLPFHYVIHGESATIQNAQLDKDYYNQGDSARVSFVWTPSADSHPLSRLGATPLDQAQVDIAIADGSGRACADQTQKDLPTGQSIQTLNIPVAITSACLNPKVSVSLLDHNGKILDELSFSVKSTHNSGAASASQPSKTKEYIIIFIAVLLIVSVILMVVYRIRHKKVIIFILFLLGSALLFGAQGPSATGQTQGGGVNGSYGGTFTMPDTWYNGGTIYGPTYTVGIDKPVYSPGDTITATSVTVQDAVCDNGFSAGSAMEVAVAGQHQLLYDDVGNLGGSFSTSVESAPGNYQAVFTGHQVSTQSGHPEVYGITADYPIGYTVRAQECTPGVFDPARCRACDNGVWEADCSNYGDGSVPAQWCACDTTICHTYSNPGCYTCTPGTFDPVNCRVCDDTGNWTANCSNYGDAGHPSTPAQRCACETTICHTSPDPGCAPPTVTLTASPNPVAYNTASLLTWTPTNAASCWGSSDTWSGGWMSNTPSSESTGNLTTAQTYYIECWNSLGVSSGQKSVKVDVNPVGSPPTPGACGPAAQQYPAGSIGFSGAYCNTGTQSPINPNPSTFPTVGNPTTWLCLGQNGGANSPTCTASLSAPVCTPSSSYQCLPTGSATCTDQTCGTTITSKSYGCFKVDTCPSATNPAANPALCVPNCSNSNQKITCPACSDPWKEVSPK